MPMFAKKPRNRTSLGKGYSASQHYANECNGYAMRHHMTQARACQLILATGGLTDSQLAAANKNITDYNFNLELKASNEALAFNDRLNRPKE